MRFSGSADLFQNNGRNPWNSINFMVSHDGFTLADLYRFNFKNNNQKFPAGPSDGGSDNNESWDQGGDPAPTILGSANGLCAADAERRHPNDDWRRRVSTVVKREQQRVQSGHFFQLAQLFAD